MFLLWLTQIQKGLMVSNCQCNRHSGFLMITRVSHIVCVAAFVFWGLIESATAQLTYVTNNGAITITGYSSASLSVIIPSTISGYPVTTIGSGAFDGDLTLTSVTIPG